MLQSSLWHFILIFFLLKGVSVVNEPKVLQGQCWHSADEPVGQRDLISQLVTFPKRDLLNYARGCLLKEQVRYLDE